jgi:DNA-binding NarL/FixJ family response regulator
MTRRVAIVEDDARYRESLETLLGYSPDFEAAGSFASTEALERELERLAVRGAAVPWELALVDLELPGQDGIHATRRLKEHAPRSYVVIVTVFEDPSVIVEAISAGADGYLLKTASARELLEALRNVVTGGSSLTPAVARHLLEWMRGHSPPSDSGARSPHRLDLTDRERAVLRGLVDGLSYGEIASSLDVALDTVRTHVRNVYRKLRVRNVAQAVGRAIRDRLV